MISKPRRKGHAESVSEGGGKRIEKTQPGSFSVDDLADAGTDDGTHVADYGASAGFNGKTASVTIERKKLFRADP